MQDEALYKCRFLLFEDPVLEAQPRRNTRRYTSAVCCSLKILPSKLCMEPHVYHVYQVSFIFGQLFLKECANDLGKFHILSSNYR